MINIMINRKEQWSWMLQALSGGLLVFLLGVHWIAQHYIVAGGLRTYQDVLNYLRTPAVFALEVIFLIIVTVHAFLGLRAVLLDTGLSNQTIHRLNLVLLLLGFATIWYGISLVWSILG